MSLRRIFAPIYKTYKRAVYVFELVTLQRIGWLYVVYSWSFPYLFKVGIVNWGNSVKVRRNQIAAELSERTGRDVCVRIAVVLPFLHAEGTEQRLHAILTRLGLHYTGMPKHSGYTEWFQYLNPITALASLTLARVYGVDQYTGAHAGLVAVFGFFPFDAVLLAVFAFALEVAVIFAAVYIPYFIYFNT